jgi:hypothetical protein
MGVWIARICLLDDDDDDAGSGKFRLQENRYLPAQAWKVMVEVAGDLRGFVSFSRPVAI